MRPGGPPPDDDPAADWAEDRDTEITLTPDELLEFDQDARTPELPGYGLGVEVGIGLGETRGAARVLHAIRDQFLAEGAGTVFADEFVRRLAAKAGVTLG